MRRAGVRSAYTVSVCGSTARSADSPGWRGNPPPAEPCAGLEDQDEKDRAAEPGSGSSVDTTAAVIMVGGTVYEAFQRTLARHGGREFLSILPETAQHYGIEARSYTYAQAADEIATLANRYAAAGLRAGQRVGLMLENRPAMFFHWLALNSLGVSAVPLNPDWREAELEYVVGHSEMVAAIVPSTRVDELGRAAERIGHRLSVGTENLVSAVVGTTDDRRPAPATGSTRSRATGAVARGYGAAPGHAVAGRAAP